MDASEHETVKNLINAGKKAEARAMLAGIVKANPKDGRAWYGLSLVIDDPERKAYCQKKASEFAPAPVKQPASPRSAAWQVWNIVAILGLLLAAIGVFCGVMGDPYGPFRDSLILLAGVGALALVIGLAGRIAVR